MLAAQLKYTAGEPLPKPGSVIAQVGLFNTHLFLQAITSRSWVAAAKQGRWQGSEIELSVATKSKP